jgi:hypothetical protein
MISSPYIELSAPMICSAGSLKPRSNHTLPPLIPCCCTLQCAGRPSAGGAVLLPLLPQRHHPAAAAALPHLQGGGRGQRQPPVHGHVAATGESSALQGLGGWEERGGGEAPSPYPTYLPGRLKEGGGEKGGWWRHNALKEHKRRRHNATKKEFHLPHICCLVCCRALRPGTPPHPP